MKCIQALIAITVCFVGMFSAAMAGETKIQIASLVESANSTTPKKFGVRVAATCTKDDGTSAAPGAKWCRGGKIWECQSSGQWTNLGTSC